jgi:oligosaccharide repeat unit polymerase
MALTVANWLLIVRLVGGFEAFLVSHWYLRNEVLAERYGDLFVLQEHLDLANQILFTSGASLHTSLGLRNRDTNWKFTALILLFFIIELLLSGNRIFFALYLLALVISCWLYGRRNLLIAALALSPIIAQIFGMWASLRHDLTAIQDSYDAYVEQNVGNPYVTTLMDATEGTNVMLLLRIIQDFGTRHDYFYGNTYSRTITSVIPRRIYPQKPENFTVLLARVYLPNEATSLNATALGEMYANFGPFSLVLFPMFSLGVVTIGRWAARTEQSHPLTPAVLFVLLVWVARSTFADSCTELILIVLIIRLFRLERGLTSPKAIESESLTRRLAVSLPRFS